MLCGGKTHTAHNATVRHGSSHLSVSPPQTPDVCQPCLAGLATLASVAASEMPRPKPAAAKGKDKRQAIEKDKVDVRESTRAKVDEILAQPLSAFVMFGFAQRNLLKKQKPNATPKEVVKAIGACSCAD